jgi:hypothetical protein
VRPAASPETGKDPANETFDRFREGFERAAAETGETDRCFRVGGVSIRLRFAGDVAEELYWPTFEPFAVEPAGAEALEVLIWDTATTGVGAPRLPWRREEASGDYVARYAGPEVLALQDYGRPALTLVRPGDGVAIHHLPDPESANWLDRASALRFALFALLRTRGVYLIHAAAVGRDGRGVLLGGPSGSGKSTLSIACLLAGMEWAGDDYVALESADPPRVHAHHAMAKMDAPAIERLGAGGLIAGGPVGPWRKYAVDASRGGRIARTMEVAAVVIPRRVAGETELSPAKGADAFAALAPTTLFQQSSRDRGTAAALGELVRRVPVRSLSLSEDDAANVRAVGRVLDELA